MMQITEDTPPDMLAGAMDLTVYLPHQPPVKMSVNRSTPMMDLLVQVTTAHRLQPSAHIIQALGFASNSNQSDIILPYKPNTPIGALDTRHIKIIPKSPSKHSNKQNVITPAVLFPIGNRTHIVRTNDNLPFETTFRLQVHLPRNQLYVIRVNQYTALEHIMKKVCTEKNLDENKYEFRHSANLHEVLDPKLTLSDYQLTEVSLVQKGKAIVSDMAALQREEERRRQQGRNGGGVFNLIFKKNKNGVGSSSILSDTRSISPTRSDSSQSRSVTPPAIQTPKILESIHQENEHVSTKPKPPTRKRRPAPKPPIQTTVKASNTTEHINETQQQNENSVEASDISSTNLIICHSRNSSDSSGYHEASILSDSVNVQTLPRRNKNLTASNNNIHQHSGTLPTHFEERNKNNMIAMGCYSKSASNLTVTGQKKKRAPPPPPVLTSSVSVSDLSTPSPPVVVSAKNLETKVIPETPGSFSRDNGIGIIPTSEEIIIPKPKPKPRSVFLEQSNLLNNCKLLQGSSLSDLSKVMQTANIYDKKDVKNSNLNYDSSYNLDLSENTLSSPNSFHKLEEKEVVDVKNEDILNDKFVRCTLSNCSTLNKSEIDDNVSVNSSVRYTDDDEFNAKDIQEFVSNELTKSVVLTHDKTERSITSKNCTTNPDIEKNIFSTSSLNDMYNSALLLDSVSIRKWTVSENLDEMSLASEDTNSIAWVIGESNSDTESVEISSTEKVSTNLNNISSDKPTITDNSEINETLFDSEKIDSSSVNLTEMPELFFDKSKEPISEIALEVVKPPPQFIEPLSINTSETNSMEIKSVELNSDPEWQYQLPSPPTAFRDSSPLKFSEINQGISEEDNQEVNILAPELLKKLEQIQDSYTSENNIAKFTSREHSETLSKKLEQIQDSYTSENNIAKFTSREHSETLSKKLEQIQDSYTSENKIAKFTSQVYNETPPIVESIIVPSPNEFTDVPSPPKEFSDITDNVLMSENFTTTNVTVENRKIEILEKELTSSHENQNNVKNEIFSKSNRQDSFISELEEVIQNNDLKTAKFEKKSKEDVPDYNSLPNFKLTTYDQPKRVINIFEDDSIRSNVDNKIDLKKRESNIKQNNIFPVKRSSGISERDMNIINTVHSQNDFKKPVVVDIKKKSNVDDFKQSQSVVSRKKNVKNSVDIVNNSCDKSVNIQRSDSFHTSELNYSDLNPVKRSKSYISLNKYRQSNEDSEKDNLFRKTSSQWSIPELQSLQVMRTILPKISNSQPNSPIEESCEIKKENVTKVCESLVSERRVNRYSPPSINLGTWSERPKSQINIKSDSDYRLGGMTISSNQKKVICEKDTEVTHDVNSAKAINDKRHNFKINTSYSVPSEFENVVHESFAENSLQEQVKKNDIFVRNSKQSGLRSTETHLRTLPRPHSTALESYQDVSRVPIVRAVELKKSPKDNLGSTLDRDINVSSVFRSNNLGTQTIGRNVKNYYQSAESINRDPHFQNYYVSNNNNNNNNNENKTESNSKSTIQKSFQKLNSSETHHGLKFGRGNSFAFNRANINIMPVVKGFRNLTSNNNIFTNGAETEQKCVNNTNNSNENNNSQRPTNLSKSCNSTNVKCQVTVNGVTQNFGNSQNYSVPSPPTMPKVTAFTKKVTKVNQENNNARDELLNAIRNFGKDNLKPIRY